MAGTSGAGDTPATTTRRLLRRDERRAQLVHAAAVAFSRAGFAATSMEDVAAEAGVTKLIVYRHFDSKEELYRAVLERVSGRLAERFAAAVEGGEGRGFAVRSMLAVAREDPDAFRLLWVHAAREPAFADYAEQFRAGAVGFADAFMGGLVADRVLRPWATRMAVAYTVDAVLGWLDEGDPAHDGDFHRAASAGLGAMVSAIAGSEPARGPAADGPEAGAGA